jgi:hypothetical protein
MNNTIIDMFEVDCQEAFDLEGLHCNDCDCDLELHIERAGARRIEGVASCPEDCGYSEPIEFDILVVVNN